MVNCYIQLIKLSKTSIVLTYQQQIYIFNVPEGFQRFISDYCIKMKSSPTIFFTQFKVEQVNGIIGLLLTLNFDRQLENSKIYGPIGICNYMQKLRYSEIGGKNLNGISIHEFYGPNLYYNKWQEQNDKEPQIHKLIHLDENNPISYYTDENLSILPIKHKQNNISYIITTNKIKGNVSQEKLSQFKLTNLQKKELFQNHQIEIENKIYQEDFFRESDILPQSIAILDIIDDDDLDQIKFNENLQCIFHLNDPSTQKYQQFIQQIKVDQMLCNQEKRNYYSDGLPKTRVICNYLNSLFPQNFPFYYQQYVDKEDQFLRIESYNAYNILPLNQKGYRKIPDQLIGGISQIRKITFKDKRISNINYKSNIKLQFLGTASMRPNKYRNVSGIYIQTQDNAILLDCGEGTLNQLLVQQNFNKFQPILIWVSHIHCDHNLGIASLMQHFPNCILIIPQIMIPWLITIRDSFELYFENIRFCIIPSDDITLEQEFINQNQKYQSFPMITLEQINNLFNLRLTYTKVDHCPQAYGVRIDFIDGSSISYSGDTRPCQQFCELSKNVDLMIHEATFTDDLIKNALERKHSTIREAVESAIQANAKNLILTHFSQRYCKFGQQQQTIKTNKILNEITQNIYEDYLQNKTIIALDFLSGYLDEYPDLVQLSQELQQLVE